MNADAKNTIMVNRKEHACSFSLHSIGIPYKTKTENCHSKSN